jgi:hypothetical protein
MAVNVNRVCGTLLSRGATNAAPFQIFLEATKKRALPKPSPSETKRRMRAIPVATWKTGRPGFAKPSFNQALMRKIIRTIRLGAPMSQYRAVMIGFMIETNRGTIMKIAVASKIIKVIERVFARIRPSTINPIKGRVNRLRPSAVLLTSHKVLRTPYVVNRR